MVPLPKPMSRNATEIEAAISEGRAEEAMYKLIGILREKPDDRAVRNLAADWIERIGLPDGAAKKLRKGRPSLPDDWLSISEMVVDLQSKMTYAEAVAQTAAHFDYAESHVIKCVALWNRAKAESCQP